MGPRGCLGMARGWSQMGLTVKGARWPLCGGNGGLTNFGAAAGYWRLPNDHFLDRARPPSSPSARTAAGHGASGRLCGARDADQVALGVGEVPDHQARWRALGT